MEATPARAAIKPPLRTLDYAPPVPIGQRLRPVLRALLAPGAAILVLGSLVLVSLSSGVRTPSLQTSCGANLRWIGRDLHRYANDHGGALPATLAQLHPAYTPDPRVFVCPGDAPEDPARATGQAVAADLAAGWHLSYVYLGRGLDLRKTPRDTVIAFEWPHREGPHQHFVSVLFADGHVEGVRDYRPILDQLAAGVRPVRLRTHPWTGATSAPPTGPTTRPMEDTPAARTSD